MIDYPELYQRGVKEWAELGIETYSSWIKDDLQLDNDLLELAESAVCRQKELANISYEDFATALATNVSQQY